MPVEIREVLIRAVVDPKAAAAQGSGGGGGGNANEGGGPAAQSAAEIVKQVFEKLREREER
jgi:hypothetical protein